MQYDGADCPEDERYKLHDCSQNIKIDRPDANLLLLHFAPGHVDLVHRPTSLD